MKRAHRLVKIKPSEWGQQACRVSEASPRVWVNTVGTFGVASAAVHWARLFSGIHRAAYYLTGALDLFLLTYVDDLLFITKGKEATNAVAVALFFMVIVGVPFSWKKCQGGLQVDWVGYSVKADCNRVSIGISEGRAKWIINFIQVTVERGRVRVDDFVSALGRMSFAFMALEHLRPFLGPLYTWSTAVAACSVLPLPKAVVLVLKFIQHMLERGWRLQPVGAVQEKCVELFRCDAKAEGEVICVGGWAVRDGTDTARCRWFSERLDRRTASWAFISGEPFRAIASLELLATLIGLILFKPAACERASLSCSAATDNLGNSCVLSCLMTTKFPLGAILMEVAAVLMEANMALRLDWLPRLQNVEADALTNEDFRGFDPNLRLRFNLDDYKGIILQSMLQAGLDLYEDVREARQKKGLQAKKQKVSKAPKEPWA